MRRVRWCRSLFCGKVRTRPNVRLKIALLRHEVPIGASNSIQAGVATCRRGRTTLRRPRSSVRGCTPRNSDRCNRLGDTGYRRVRHRNLAAQLRLKKPAPLLTFGQVHWTRATLIPFSARPDAPRIQRGCKAIQLHRRAVHAQAPSARNTANHTKQNRNSQDVLQQ